MLLLLGATILVDKALRINDKHPANSRPDFCLHGTYPKV